MTKVLTRDFRVTFARMADHAIVNRHELAELLSTSPEAISQMGYRRELPMTAFLEKRKACWFVADIRTWLDATAARRQLATASTQVQARSALAGHGCRFFRMRSEVGIYRAGQKSLN